MKGRFLSCAGKSIILFKRIGLILLETLAYHRCITISNMGCKEYCISVDNWKSRERETETETGTSAYCWNPLVKCFLRKASQPRSTLGSCGTKLSSRRQGWSTYVDSVINKQQDASLVGLHKLSYIYLQATVSLVPRPSPREEKKRFFLARGRPGDEARLL